MLGECWVNVGLFCRSFIQKVIYLQQEILFIYNIFCISTRFELADLLHIYCIDIILWDVIITLVNPVELCFSRVFLIEVTSVGVK